MSRSGLLGGLLERVVVNGQRRLMAPEDAYRIQREQQLARQQQVATNLASHQAAIDASNEAQYRQQQIDLERQNQLMRQDQIARQLDLEARRVATYENAGKLNATVAKQEAKQAAEKLALDTKKMKFGNKLDQAGLALDQQKQKYAQTSGDREFLRKTIEGDRAYGLDKGRFELDADKQKYSQTADQRDYLRKVLEGDRSFGLDQDQYMLDTAKNAPGLLGLAKQEVEGLVPMGTGYPEPGALDPYLKQQYQIQGVKEAAAEVDDIHAKLAQSQYTPEGKRMASEILGAIRAVRSQRSSLTPDQYYQALNKIIDNYSVSGIENYAVDTSPEEDFRKNVVTVDGRRYIRGRSGWIRDDDKPAAASKAGDMAPVDLLGQPQVKYMDIIKDPKLGAAYQKRAIEALKEQHNAKPVPEDVLALPFAPSGKEIADEIRKQIDMDRQVYQTMAELDNPGIPPQQQAGQTPLTGSHHFMPQAALQPPMDPVVDSGPVQVPVESARNPAMPTQQLDLPLDEPAPPPRKTLGGRGNGVPANQMYQPQADQRPRQGVPANQMYDTPEVNPRGRSGNERGAYIRQQNEARKKQVLDAAASLGVDAERLGSEWDSMVERAKQTGTQDPEGMVADLLQQQLAELDPQQAAPEDAKKYPTVTADEAGYAAWEQLPPGSKFIDPKGKLRTK